MTDAEILEEAERVAVRMRAAGVWVSFDLRVRTDAAADMLGKAPKTLINWRAQNHPLRYVRGATPTYRITELLRFIYSGQDDVAA
jgi:hypothetical protein